jgi:hypothetical protein
MSTHNLLPRRLRPLRRAGGSSRRVWAAKVARALLPASAALGGFVSTQIEVVDARGVSCPDVALACREPPADGRLAHPPDLVVVAGVGAAATAEAARWLAAGVAAVWCVGVEHVVEHRPGALPRTHDRAATLAVPAALGEPTRDDLVVPVRHLLP